MNAPERAPIRLTQLAHGGGCGCKVAPAVLREILQGVDRAPVPKALLVGIETSDDAAVYQVSASQAIVATTDFFMTIVDDPFDFGAIAATNALSDVYAMGATPLFALAIVGMPIATLAVDTIRRILDGGQSTCLRAGIPVAGGHTIDTAEPIYGLVAIGSVDPRHLQRNVGARPGDVIVLGKPLGVGIYGAAEKRGELPPACYRAMIDSTTRLNTPGIALAQIGDVHALTDVTGFGLIGHLLEMCRGGNVSASIAFDRLPLLPQVRALAAAGFVTGASKRNWDGYGNDVRASGSIGDVERAIATDPQTSGGLLVACAPSAVDAVLEVFRREGFGDAAPIGKFEAGAPCVTLA
ncbi:MAG TPA: selenide, water dikinase SelD [Casimicrobiaceae bacterium]|nr:selenide, water dikinase SelD [Casimicrobiaceae bacterium]